MQQSVPDKPLSKKEERRLLESGRRVLLGGGYPNPERVGCPASEVLKAIADRKMDLRKAKEWTLHVGSCSPCFTEYTAFRKETQTRKIVKLALASAAVLVLIGGAVWLWKAHRVMPYQSVTLDLTQRMVFRGGEHPPANTEPLLLPRGRLDLTILLPLFSEPGNYQVQVSTKSEKPLASATGTAVIQNATTVLKVKLDVSSVNPGSYLLRIALPDIERFYPLVVK